MIKEDIDIAPLGIDEPQMLWDTGAWIHYAADVPPSGYDETGYISLLMSETEAWKARALWAQYITDVESDPYPISLMDALARARECDVDFVLVCTAEGRVIEEYPV